MGDQVKAPEYVVAKTASSTLTHQENGALITNRGAAATTTHALPKASHSKGIRYRFLRVAAFAVRVDPQATDQIMDVNGALFVAGKYQELGTDGATLDYVSDGTNWVNVAERGTINDE